MFLTNREQEKLMIYTASKLSLERKEKGLKLNYPESVSIISNFILEGARSGESVEKLIMSAKKVLNTNDVLDGVASMMNIIQVEATFEDGAKLVTVNNPIEKNKDTLVAGEYFIDDGEIDLNQGYNTLTVKVQNNGDRSIQVGSHYHFFETNCFLNFNRIDAYGKRLNIPSGTSVIFEPGSIKKVDLVDFGGKRYISGFNGLVEGFLDYNITKTKAIKKLKKFLEECQ